MNNLFVLEFDVMNLYIYKTKSSQLYKRDMLFYKALITMYMQYTKILQKMQSSRVFFKCNHQQAVQNDTLNTAFYIA